MKPRVGVVHVRCDPDDASDSAAKIDARRAAIARVAPAVGVEIADLDAADVDAEKSKSDARPFEVFGGTVASIWWLGRIVFLDESCALAAALARHAPGVRTFDPPDEVEEAFNLALTYPLLAKADVPQADTKFVALSRDEARLPARELSALIRSRLRWSWIRGQRFIRTYYGTRKLHGFMNLAFSKEEVVEKATDLAVALRETQEIGGIAIRAVLPIRTFFDSADRVELRREFRVFCVNGRPTFWTLHCDLTDLVFRISPEDLARVGGMPDAQRAELLAIARRAAGVLRARFLAVDVTELDDGRLVAIETNPGHSSGWAHPAAFVGAHGQMLRFVAELPLLDPDACARAAEECGFPLWGRGVVWDFVRAS